MILIDTSIWVDHLRRSDGTVEALLGSRRALVHPYVVGEIALGNFASTKRRAGMLKSLSMLRPATVARHDEVLHLIEAEVLFGSGIGYVDAHLLASTRLMLGSSLWTRDKRLKAAADRLGVGITM